MKFNVDKVEFNEAELEKIEVKDLFCDNHEVVVQTLEKLKEVTKTQSLILSLSLLLM